MFDIVEQKYKKSFGIPSYYYDAIKFYLGRFVADFKEEKVEDGSCIVRWLIPDGISDPPRISHKIMWSEIKCLRDRLLILHEMSERFKTDIRLSNAEDEDVLLVRIINNILYLPVDNIESASYITKKGNLVITKWLKPSGEDSVCITARQINVFIQELCRIYHVLRIEPIGHSNTTTTTNSSDYNDENRDLRQAMKKSLNYKNLFLVPKGSKNTLKKKFLGVICIVAFVLILLILGSALLWGKEILSFLGYYGSQ